MIGRYRATLFLILLTTIAGLLRFVSLDRPSVWGDEAATYGRVAGTYQELLDQLADSSFPPLHYELEWWIGQGLPFWGTFGPPAEGGGPRTFTPTKFLVPGGIPLTPAVLRFVPAVAGTLFVPAVFFVVVQLFGRRVALWAAALACFSAYGLVYSRDAKMYMHFWLAMTLHVGCGLWWVRTWRPLPWALWLLCGVAMVGLHGSGFAILLLDLIVVLGLPRPRGRLSLPGLLAWPVTIGPAYGFERLTRRLGQPSWRWRRQLHWPRRAWWRFHWQPWLGAVVGGALFLATAYGPLGYYSAFSHKAQRLTAAEREQIDTGELGLNWVARYNAGRRLPDYLLYTVSAYSTGWEWPRPADQPNVAPRTLRLLQIATTALLLLLAVGVVPWRKVLRPVRAGLDVRRFDARVWRPFRTRRAWWIAVWITAAPWALYTQSTTHPATVFDGVATVLLRTPPDIEWPRLDVANDAARGIIERWRQAVAAAAADWPSAWKAYAAAWTWANLAAVPVAVGTVVAVIGMAWVARGRRVIGRGTVKMAVLLIVLTAAGTAVGVLPKRLSDDAWVPRYLGLTLPAFWCFAAVLIDRMPTPLRWVTPGLFVAVNMGQFAARTWGGSEPPTGLIAADVVAAQPKEIIATHAERPAFKAFVSIGSRYQTPEPGGGTLYTPTGRYYLRMLSGVPGDVRQVRLSRYGVFEDNLKLNKFVTPTLVERELAKSPWVEKFVVWIALPAGATDPKDEIGDLLRSKFRRTNEEFWTARDHWRWVERFQIRRRTYERVISPSP